MLWPKIKDQVCRLNCTYGYTQDVMVGHDDRLLYTCVCSSHSSVECSGSDPSCDNWSAICLIRAWCLFNSSQERLNAEICQTIV